MRYHYLHGVQRSWLVFFVRLAIFDLVAIVLLIAGMHWYTNQIAQHDALLLEDWCKQVMCVQIDPATGIGTPMPIEHQIKISEI